MPSKSLIVAVAAGLLGAACSWAQLPAWKMAELKDLGDGWGDAATGVERSYRPARGGRSADLTVPAWWGKTFRPPEGTVYVLEISYKDTATKPVVFSAHGGHGSYWGLSEVHRFGGLGDGAWKTAEVPLSWDLICRKNNLGQLTDLTVLAISADQDLPVEGIRVVPVKRDSAEKYNAETRAWVARVQAEKRKTASRGAKQEPVVPEGLKDQPIVPFARTYLVPLEPNAAPQKGEAGKTLKLRMARNEYETGQFGVYANGKDLRAVTVSVGELKGESGTLACEVRLKAAEYSVVQAGRGGRYELFPQRMWPAYPVDIAAGQSHAFWITIRSLGNKTAPGKYAGKVQILAQFPFSDNAKRVPLSESGTVEPDMIPGGYRVFSAWVPIEVEVLPVTLLTMQEAGLELGSCGFPTLQELKTLSEYNHTGMDIWFGGTQQQFVVRDGKLQMDFTYLDDWMAYAVKCGMTHMMWFMGGDPYGFPDTLNLERDLYRYRDGDRAALRREFIDKTSANPDKVIPELRDVYVDWVRQTADHAKKNNWPKLIIHPFDEPAKWTQTHTFENPFHKVLGSGKWIRGHFEDSCALIRQGAKGYDNVLVGGDMHHAEPSMVFLDDVDVFCTNAIHEDLKLGDKVRAAKVQFWQYSGCNDQSPAHRGRFPFGWYFAAFDSRGSLIWAYDSMGRFDTSQGSGWGYGWDTPFGVVETPFMLGLREGWDDRRWIETYKKVVLSKDPAAKALLEGIFKDAVAQRTQAGRDTVADFYAEIDRHEQMDKWRDQIIDAILKSQR